MVKGNNNSSYGESWYVDEFYSYLWAYGWACSSKGSTYKYSTPKIQYSGTVGTYYGPLGSIWAYWGLLGPFLGLLVSTVSVSTL